MCPLLKIMRVHSISIGALDDLVKFCNLINFPRFSHLKKLKTKFNCLHQCMYIMFHSLYKSYCYINISH